MFSTLDDRICNAEGSENTKLDKEECVDQSESFQ